MRFTTDDLLQRHKLVVHPVENKFETDQLLGLLEEISKENSGHNVKNKTVNTSQVENMDTNKPTLKGKLGAIYCAGCKTTFAESKYFQSHISTCLSGARGEPQVETKVVVETVKIPLPKKEVPGHRRASPGGYCIVVNHRTIMIGSF